MKQFLCFFIYLVFNLEITAATIGQSSSMLSTSKWAFEENRGQVTGADSALVTYFYKKGDMTMFLTKTGIAYQFDRAIYPEGYKSIHNKDFSYTGEDVYKERDRMDSLRKLIRYESYRMDIELLGANPHAEILREGESTDYIQYYNHNVLGVRSYQKIIYKNIYPNIDWVIYKKGESTKDKGLTTNDYVKYDFIVHPGGNPSDIKLKTYWVEDLKLNEDGSLTLKNRLGSITDQKPISYQQGKELATSFYLDKDIVSFNLPAYNTSQDLIIDPSVVWSTYYGGNRDEFHNQSFLYSISDSFGNIYLSGTTKSFINISSGGFQNIKGDVSTSNYSDAYLVKFNSSGQRIWATYYGGLGMDQGSNTLIDKYNNIYLIGQTESSTNISYNGYQDTFTSGVWDDAFLVKFNSSGQRIWGTYIGGDLNELFIRGVIDKNDDIYIVGETNSTNKINLNGFQPSNNGAYDFFIVKFNINGSKVWGTYFGGSNNDGGQNTICVDNLGYLYVTGSTQSNALFFNGFFNNTSAGWGSSIIVKFSTNNGSRIWSSYFPTDRICESKIDKDNNLYLCGFTQNVNMTINGNSLFNNSFNGGSYDAFLVKFNSNLTHLWGKLFGGVNNDYFLGMNISRDSKHILCVGESYSSGLSYNGFQNIRYSSNYSEGLVFKIDSNSSNIWSSYFGGDSFDRITASLESKKGGFYIAGLTNSIVNISKFGHQNSIGGLYDAFLTKIGIKPTITISPTNTIVPCQGKGKSFTSAITNGGSNPQYQWFYQNQLVGTSANLTLYPSGSDTLYCVLTSNEEDRSDDTVWSNKIFVSVLKNDSTNKYDTICSNQNYIFKSQLLNTTGIYKDSMASSSGCDSFVFLHLHVKPTSASTYSFTSTCSAKPSYYFNNQTLTQSGIYKDTFPAANGCDSVVTLDLTLKSTTNSSFDKYICPGQTYLFNGIPRTTTGLYTRIVPNASGCDSTITLDLKVLTTPTGVNNIIWACNPYVFNTKTYTSNAIVIDTVKSNYGCDSLLRFNYINLKPLPITKPAQNHTVCDSVTIKNIVHKASFSFTDTTRTTQNVVCDSLYQMTNYTIKYTPTITLSTKQEDTFFKGENITISANNIKNYRWSTGETKRDISFKLTQNESFYLIAWNDPECQDTAYTHITALDATILEFPTGFSPMSKKPENQVFRPNIVGKIERIQLDIFNRLGVKVYSSNNIFTLGWDGTYKGVASPQGVYTYLIEYVTNKRIFFKSGEVQLVR